MARRRQPNHSHRQVFTWLIVFSIACLFLPKRLTDNLDEALSLVLRPLGQKSRWVSLAATGKVRQWESGAVKQTEQGELEKRRGQNRLINLTEELGHQRALVMQLSGLRQKFGLARARLIEARVVGDDSSGWRQIKRLDQGSLHHLAAGQVVLGGVDGYRGDTNSGAGDVYQMSVVGMIKAAAIKSSTLQLINDPGFRMEVFVEPAPGRNEQWRAKGMLRGEGMSEISVKMVSASYPVRKGDVILTSLEEKYLPTGMVVGSVKSCKRDDENPVLWRIGVEAQCDLGSLQRVIVVDAD